MKDFDVSPALAFSTQDQNLAEMSDRIEVAIRSLPIQLPERVYSGLARTAARSVIKGASPAEPVCSACAVTPGTITNAQGLLFCAHCVACGCTSVPCVGEAEGE